MGAGGGRRGRFGRALGAAAVGFGLGLAAAGGAGADAGLPGDPRAACLPAVAASLEACVVAFSPLGAGASAEALAAGFDGLAQERCCADLRARFHADSSEASANCLCLDAVARAADDVLASYGADGLADILSTCGALHWQGQEAVGWAGSFIDRQPCPGALRNCPNCVTQDVEAKAMANAEVQQLLDDVDAALDVIDGQDSVYYGGAAVAAAGLGTAVGAGLGAAALLLMV